MLPVRVPQPTALLVTSLICLPHLQECASRPVFLVSIKIIPPRPPLVLLAIQRVRPVSPLLNKIVSPALAQLSTSQPLKCAWNHAVLASTRQPVYVLVFFMFKTGCHDSCVECDGPSQYHCTLCLESKFLV